MTNEELTKYLYFLNDEYGDRGWEGHGPFPAREGWEDILKDQLKYNQFDVPKEFGLLDNREDIEQVLRSRLEDNPEYPHIKNLPTARSLMSTDGVPRGSQLLGEPGLETGPSGYNSLDATAFNQLEPWGQTSDPYLWHTQDSLKDYISENFPDPVGPAGSPSLSFPDTSSSLGLPSASAIPAASSSLALEAGPSGYASLDAAAGTTLPYAGEGISESMAAETATSGSSAWGGPATFAANQALNLIPTRDRKKKVTPFGDEGSVSGILKGTGKGALLGTTIGSYVAPGPGTLIGGLIGGGAGLIAGSQGYFDSTSAPIMNMSRIKRRGGGMQGGLLGGGSMYG